VPVVDVLDEFAGLDDVLAFGVDFALADDDGLFVGLDDDFVVAGDSWLCAGAELVQLGFGVACVACGLFVADLLGLGLVLPLGDVEADPVPEPPGLTLGVTVWLGPPLGLADPLGLPLTVLPLLGPPLADVAGAEVDAFVLLGTLVVVSVADGCVDVDAQVLTERCVITPLAPLAGALPAGEATGEAVPWPSVAPGPLEELMLRAAPIASPTCTIACRAGGTADRTTPTANTAAPTAKAGRSMASRQSRGRLGASPRPAGWPSRRNHSKMASQAPRIPRS